MYGPRGFDVDDRRLLIRQGHDALIFVIGAHDEEQIIMRSDLNCAEDGVTDDYGNRVYEVVGHGREMVFENPIGWS